MGERKDRSRQEGEIRPGSSEIPDDADTSDIPENPLPPEWAKKLPFWIEATPASRAVEERLRYQEALLFMHGLPSKGEGSRLWFRGGEELRYFLEFAPLEKKHILEIRTLVYLGTIQPEPALHQLITGFESEFRRKDRSVTIFLHDAIHLVAALDLRYRRDPLPHSSFGLVEFMGQRSLELRAFLTTVDDQCFLQRDYSQAWDVLGALAGRSWS